MLDRGTAIAAIVRLPLLAALLALAACASQPGLILAGPPADPTDLPFSAFLRASDADYFWLSTPPQSSHVLEPSDTQVTKQGLWLQQGVFYLEFECYSPKKAPQVAYPILPESADETTLYIKGGRRYLLSCDEYRIGKAVLSDLGPLPGL
ncbi:MAG TPA: hypothetical protein VFK21_05195 [Gammaproteobacteria bacterium]|nr:hypothetical protein [Gammaproteobacteria bacterium]